MDKERLREYTDYRGSRPRPPFSPWPSPTYGLPATILLTVVLWFGSQYYAQPLLQVLCAAFFSVQLLEELDAGHLSTYLSTTLVVSHGLSVLVGLVALAFVVAVKGRSLPEYCSWPGPAVRRYVLPITAGVVLTMCACAGAAIMYHQRGGLTEPSYGFAFGGSLLAFVPLVVVGPIWEETLYRGFMFAGLVHACRRPWVAIVITTAAWTVLHFPPNWGRAVLWALLGLQLGWVRHSTGSLSLAMVFHAAYNLPFAVALAAGPRPF